MLSKLVSPNFFDIFLHGAWHAFLRTFSLLIWFLLSMKPLKPEVNLSHVEIGNGWLLKVTARAILHQSIIHLC